VYSLNVPVPGQVKRLADGLHPHLVALDRVREKHSILLKRLGDPDPAEHAGIQQRARRALSGTAPFEARVAGIDTFPNPPAGPGPVVYLVVESEGLRAAHERLCEAFEPVVGMEGDEYDPHVTLGRGGPPDVVDALADREVEAVEWTVGELTFHQQDATGGLRVDLPA
jgi:2'-5' RNA ligase